MQDFIQYYHNAFSSTLEKLHFSGKIPTYSDLKIELHRNRFYEVIIASAAIIFSTIDMATINLNDLSKEKHLKLEKSFLEMYKFRKSSRNGFQTPIFE